MNPLFSVLYALFCYNALVSAFSFTSTTLSQCDSFTVEWSGGTGPYQLLFVPSFGTPRNLTIPTAAYTNGKGTYSTTVPFKTGQQLVLTMSDATGFATGGISDVLTVEGSKGGTCDTKDPGVAFAFQLNYALQQCRPYTFEGFATAGTQPFTVWVVVPGGTGTSMQVPVGARTYSWPAKIPGGTSAMFMMTDGQGRHGGASDIKLVGASDDKACLNAGALSSTAARAAPTSTHVDNNPPRTSDNVSAPSGSVKDLPTGVPISAIAGTVIGSLLFLAVIVTLGLFFLKNFKKKHDRLKEGKQRPITNSFNHHPDYHSQQRQQHPYGTTGAPQLPYRGQSSANLTGDPENPFADSSPHVHTYPNSNPVQEVSYDPFSSRPYYPPTPGLATPNTSDPFNPSGPPVLPALHSSRSPSPTTDYGSATSTQRKAAMAGEPSYQPSRFLVHRDVEDELPPPNADGVVELPPLYTERQPRSNFVVVNASPPTSPTPDQQYPQYPRRGNNPPQLP